MNVHATDTWVSQRHSRLERNDYAPETAKLLAEVADWLPVVQRLGISGKDFRALVKAAAASGSTFLATLIGSGTVSENELTRACAEVIGVDFTETMSARRILASDDECMAELAKASPMVPAESADGRSVIMLLGPRDIGMPELRDLAEAARRQRRRLVLMPTSALRQTISIRVSRQLTAFATHGLLDWRPDFSARDRLAPDQAFVAGAGIVVLAVLALTFPTQLFIAIHVVGIAFFLGCSSLKALAALRGWKRVRPRWAMPSDASAMPVYSILVALHREAEVVPQLVAALSRLEWPRDRLEIKLVCEADDNATIEAIRGQNLPAFFEIVAVPPSLPRTKPKALRYAQAMTSGEFIVLYDAEDRPHPGQLLEAYARFEAGDSSLVCLQAPLSITNAGQSLIARMFAFEYAGLFRSVLPWLAAHSQILPLGGTSNHFRRDALEEVGSWDPHNVTEDADLGMRLFRFGYRCETLTLPTLEAAPEEFRVWLPQRTRWLKGWLQTWLVHMRRPHELFREVGVLSFATGQVLLAGMYFSALLHPVIFLSALAYAALLLAGNSLNSWQLWLMAADWAILIYSYAAFLALGWRSLTLRERLGFPVVVLMTPFYWLMISWAAWMALAEFIRHPHRWNKTPHKPVS